MSVVIDFLRAFLLTGSLSASIAVATAILFTYLLPKGSPEMIHVKRLRVLATVDLVAVVAIFSYFAARTIISPPEPGQTDLPYLLVVGFYAMYILLLVALSTTAVTAAGITWRELRRISRMVL